MARKIPTDRLAQEVEKILGEYGDDVQGNLSVIVSQMSKKGANTLRQQSRNTFGGSGKYAKGWTSTVETGRVSTQGTIYNKTPGLPHLLEHGHALKRGGRTLGRVEGREHIKPVEEALVKEFESKVKSKL